MAKDVVAIDQKGQKLAMQKVMWGMVLKLASAPNALACAREKLAQPHQKCPSMNDKPRKRRLVQRLQKRVVLAQGEKNVTYLLELLDGTLVNTTALVDQVYSIVS